MFKPHVPLSCLTLALIASACGAPDDAELGADESFASHGSALKVDAPVPSPALDVPDGHRIDFFHDAIGVQIYQCQNAESGYGWVFLAPEASLLDRHGRPVIDHLEGPTWESLRDGSKVVASKVASFVEDPSAIPALLLVATEHEGAGRLSKVSYIQRLETAGGMAPSSACDSTNEGELARVDYTATYYFYRAHGRCN